MARKRLIDPSFFPNAKNKFYASNLDDLIEETKSFLWLHGHMHTPYAVKIGDTRIIRNPRGYNFPYKGLGVQYFAGIIDV